MEDSEESSINSSTSQLYCSTQDAVQIESQRNVSQDIENNNSQHDCSSFSNQKSISPIYPTVTTTQSSSSSSIRNRNKSLSLPLSSLSSSSKTLNVSDRMNNSSYRRSCSRRNRTSSNIFNSSIASNASAGFYTSEIIMSVVEGRGKAKGEIGMAYLDLNSSPILHVSQFMDNYSFDSLKMKCQVYTPVEIIFPHTLTENNMMMSSLVKTFTDIEFKPFDRKFFNEKKGFEFIQTLSFDDFQWIDLQLENKYYCLAACSALFQYLLTIKQIQYAPKSIKIIYQSSLNTLIIDPTSAKILELIINLSNPKSSDTLLGTINRTKTRSGYIMLRSSILQPSTSLNLITKRLDMVEAISSSIDNFNSFENILINFSAIDLDQLLVNLAQLPINININSSASSFLRLAEKKIDYVIHTKHAISLVDQLRQILEECNAGLFSEYLELLDDPNFEAIKNMIDEVINSNTKCVKGGCGGSTNANMKLEKCFAIKDRFNPLLDLVRSIYSETIDDIIALVQAYETKYCVDGIKVNYSTMKGFHMQIKQMGRSDVESSNKDYNNIEQKKISKKLPSIFKDVNITKTHITFTTDDLMRLNNRIKQTVEEIYLQSDNIITKLITDIRTKIQCLYNLTEIVSNIDLLFSFAYQSSCCNYVRPNFSKHHTEIIDGTHPVLDKISVSVANSIFLSDDLNFHIITGPNMSGKTTLLKQIALLQIMAQIGSFVPAKYASFRICDKLFTRMALNDNLQMNSSSFMVEIKELHYILKHQTSNCLILIDELGRDSTFDESFQTYWSICESLLLSPAFTIFATHFLQITALSSFYLNVTNHHFSSEIIENNFVCKYPHILLPGPTEERLYGIKLAEMSGLDENIISYAKNLTSELSNNGKSSNNNVDVSDKAIAKNIIQYQAKYKLAAKLIHLIRDRQQMINIDLIRRLQIEYEEMMK